MKRSIVLFLFVALLCISSSSQDTKPSLITNSTPDFSKESFVFEHFHTKLRFESDGTGTKENLVRIKIQSEAGVQQLGLVRIGYNSASEKITIAYVKVIKPDGSIVTANTDSIQDLAGEIPRIAPQYTDFREKHINVPGLRPGDTLEYKVETSITAPDIPGQFYTEYLFERNIPIVDEQLTIDVPADRKLVTKFGAEFTPAKKTENGRTIYSWKHANLITHNDEPASVDDAEDKQPDIQLTTFLTWADLGKWYSSLETPRAEPDDAIRKKAAELTAGLSTEKEKVQVIYNYVSTNVRYVGLSFGTGRFQPHPASETMVAQYGDCKDKHTLLAALLAAVSIKADTILIHSGQKLDPDVPSPAQFNHLIGAVRLGEHTFYSDTTAEVAPLGMLVQPLRGKQALLITRSGEAKLIRIPKDPLQPNRDLTDITAKINEAGDLVGDIVNRPEGDTEMADRLVFRRTSEAQWPQVLKAVISVTGINAEVSKVSVKNLEENGKPFELRYHFEQKKFVDIKSTTQIKLPALSFMLRPAATPDQKKGPIRLGTQESIHRLRLEVPAGFLILTPNVEVAVEDFVDYRATYKVENKNVLIAERSYRVTKDEVPRARYTDYNRVYEKVNADEEKLAYFTTVPGSKLAATVAAKDGQRSGASGDSKEGLSSQDLFNAGSKALQARNFREAQSLLETLVKRDPKYPNVWAMLASIYLTRAHLGKTYVYQGIDALRKEVENNPKNEFGAWQQLAMAYFLVAEYSEAADALAHQVEISPNQTGLRIAQASMLVRAGRPQDAIAPLEAEVQLNPLDTTAQLELAKAYILSGQKEKAEPIVSQLVTNAHDPMAHASIANMLGEANDSLDLAEGQLQQALASAYEALQPSDLTAADEPALQRAWKLASIWQSAGQLYLKRGDLPRAQIYLEAAWSWAQQFRAGELLADVYSQQGRNVDAMRTLAEALSTSGVQYPEARSKLDKLAGNAKNSEQLIAQHRLDLQQVRTLDIPNASKISGLAEFYIFVGPGSKIEALRFHEGETKLKKMSENLKKARLELPFPDEQPIHVLRSGTMSCYSLSPSCKFVLNPPPTMMVRYDRDGF